MFATASTPAGLYAMSVIVFGMAVVGSSYLAATFRPRPKYRPRHSVKR
jgi:hypothetical protein